MDIRELAQEDFPPLLAEIPEPPKKLYLRGALPTYSHKLLAVVGSRNYSSYGKDVCEKLISGLSGYPITIVSGLALGIDAIAHKAALAANLKTIAVPGSGLDDSVLYPRTNLGLAKEILHNGGTLLSEFEPEHKARPENFPQRNRIMAGISNATLVIEAGEKSGTLITARLATDYNRDVFAVPGSIFQANTSGSHRLIRLGAALIDSSGTLLQELGFSFEEKNASPENVSENEAKVIALVQNPISRNELVRDLSLPIQEANALLTEMELKGLIVESGGEIRKA